MQIIRTCILVCIGEMFFRAGGLSCINPLMETGLSVFNQALKYLELERTVNYGAAIVKYYELKKDDVIIVEGLHALNPVITQGLDESHIYKVYISVSSRVTDDEGRVIFSKRNLRLVRRMIRDYHYRNTPVEKTFSQWPEVLKGEGKYIFPYEKNARYRIDSFHPYESCIFRNEAVELLDTVEKDSRFYPLAEQLKEDFSKLRPIDISKMPNDSLLREFI